MTCALEVRNAQYLNLMDINFWIGITNASDHLHNNNHAPRYGDELYYFGTDTPQIFIVESHGTRSLTEAYLGE